MQVVQLILSILIVICAVGMFIGAVVSEQSVHFIPLALLFVICLLAVKMLRVVFQELQSEND